MKILYYISIILDADPFWDQYIFSIDNDMINFHGNKISPTDSMITGDYQELSRVFHI